MRENMKKVLVIGASGSLGKGVVKEIKADYEVTGTYASRPFSMDGMEAQKLDRDCTKFCVIAYH